MTRSTVATLVLLIFINTTPVLAASPYGVDGFLSTRADSTQMATSVGLLNDLGAGWTRQEFNYENMGGPSGSNFGADNEALTQSQNKGLKVLGLLNFGSDTPPSVANWNQFVRTVVGHFTGRVAAWEIMNEPNDAARPGRQMSPSTYENYLADSYTAIKQLDPTATVVSAGTAAVDVDWIKGLFDAGGCTKLDAVAIHPYRNDAPELVKFGEGDFINYIRMAVATLRTNCPGKKLWLTEFGLRTDVVGGTKQANYLARSFLMARAIPEVETILAYDLRDDSSGAWGVVNEDFSKKTVFTTIQDVFSQTGAKTYDGDITITDRRMIDGLENVDGWGQQFNNHASATLTSVDGGIENSKAMQVDYNFTDSSAAVILTKPLKLAGEPTAIGVHMYGDDSPVIWRLRFKDASGETFQALLGNPVSGWSYQQFDFSHVNAMTSWGGNADGKIQYPISFDSIVLDRNGGLSSGTVKADAIVAIYGPADLHAYKFGDTVAAWKGLNFQTVSICGQQLEIGETPRYLTNVSNCRSNDIGASALASQTSTSSSATQNTNTVRISSPSDGLSTKSRVVTVTGTYGPKTSSVRVVVDGKSATATRNTKKGTWSYRTRTLAFGDHTITATAGSGSDQAQTSITLTIKKK